MDVTLPNLLDQIYALRDPEATILARKVQKLWNDSVIPSQKDLDRLQKYLRVDGTCMRLTEGGRCAGWLRRHGEAAGVVALPPYACPFADKKPLAWRECPGYIQARQD